MRDRRQELLDRLEAILQAIATGEGIAYYRNRGDLATDKRPFIAMHDGDESATKPDQPRGGPPLSPNAVLLVHTPEITYLPQAKKPLNTDVSAAINAMRLKILPAILYDATIQTIVGSNGTVRYIGVKTDLAVSRKMEGEATFQFAFGYPLLKADLT